MTSAPGVEAHRRMRRFMLVVCPIVVVASVVGRLWFLLVATTLCWLVFLVYKLPEERRFW